MQHRHHSPFLLSKVRFSLSNVGHRCLLTSPFHTNRCGVFGMNEGYTLRNERDSWWHSGLFRVVFIQYACSICTAVSQKLLGMPFAASSPTNGPTWRIRLCQTRHMRCTRYTVHSHRWYRFRHRSGTLSICTQAFHQDPVGILPSAHRRSCGMPFSQRF